MTQHFGTFTPLVTFKDDGTIYVSEKAKVPRAFSRLTAPLHKWAKKTPNTTLFAEKQGEGWKSVSYQQMLKNVRAVAGYLLTLNLNENAPVVILSGNDLAHATLALACLEVGIPYCPVSTAYSTMSQDLSKIKYVYDLLNPQLIFASDETTFKRALEMKPAGAKTLNRVQLEALYAHSNKGVSTAHKAIKPSTIAKFLLTSGSTGMPKAVVNTHEMLCVNQAMLSHAFKFAKKEPPILVDWLPWNHTFGGNHNFNFTIFNGGTLYIDDGKPMPVAINATINNLKSLEPPTIYLNVPKGFDMLADALKADEVFAKHFCSRLKVIVYAGAALSQPTWEALKAITKRITGAEIPMATALGSTETSPASLQGNFDADKSGVVGKPLPGITLKLVPNAGKLELRIKGRNTTPGYWGNPQQTKEAYDEEGFYKIGDAVKPYIDGDYASGFVFDGRIAEDFKLASGTWVAVGNLRNALTAALAPFARDLVIAGHNRDEITAIIIPANPALVVSDAIKADVSAKLKAYNAAQTGSSTRVKRVTFLLEPLSIDVGEVTDKGSVNQRAVLGFRTQLVDDLYQAPSPSKVIS